jgi:hypothetical protein
MKPTVVLLVCVLLAACAHLLRREKVQDSRTAIEAAKADCKWDARAAKPSEQWHARLHGALWHAWLTTESSDSDEPLCCEYHGSAALDVWIRADTGKSAGCSVVRKPAVAK